MTCLVKARNSSAGRTPRAAARRTRVEGYGVAFENQWRREQGMDQRLFYKYVYGDVGHTTDDVFHWPTP
jgi:hypothetical protein